MRQTTRAAPPFFSTRLISTLLLAGAFVCVGCQSDSSSGEQANEAQNKRPFVQAANAVDAGRYIAVVSGCNDCHTEGYMQTDGKIPEEDWLTGSNLGWRGPWGTTYAANLRLRVQEISKEAWVNQMHTRHANPPMPWMNVNQMSDQDARALYEYLKSLGPKGDHVPQSVPPGEEPKTPYISLNPQTPGTPQEAAPESSK